MKRLLILTIVCGLAVASSGYAIYMPQPLWHDAGSGGGNAYYGSGVYNANGDIVKSGSDARWYMAKEGDKVKQYSAASSTPTTTMSGTWKGIVPIQSAGSISYYVESSNDYAHHPGVWSSTNFSEPAAGTQHIFTDTTGGTLDEESITRDPSGFIYMNHDADQNKITKYSVTNSPSLAVTPVWTAAAPAGVRFRAISYSADNGTPAVYAGDYNGTDKGLYAIETATGTVHRLGTHVSIKTHQTVRYGNELYVVGRDGGKIVKYDFNGTWSVDTANAQVFQVTDSNSNSPIGDSYGCGVIGNGREATGMWVANASGGDVDFFELRHDGDANEDGAVGGSDLSTLLANWNQSGKLWADGDFNGDGTVGGSDLSALLATWNWSAPSAPVAVPEPVTILLSILGFAGIIRRKK